MKKIYGFAALSAAMLLASCSNNDEPNVVPVEDNGTTGYLAVSLVNPGSTRALGDTEYGETYENMINDVTFLLFGKDESGNEVVKKIATPDMSTTYTDNTTANNNVARAYDAVIVCNGPFATLSSYDAILAVANSTLPSSIKEEIYNAQGTKTQAGSSLDDVKAIVGAYTATVNATDANKGEFVMSNSVYNDGTNDIVLTPIQGNMALSAEDAKKKAVDIYVERVLSKINVPNLTNVHKAEVANSKYGTEKLYVWVDGVEIADQAPEAYLVKNISGLSTSRPFSNWNKATAFRSFWAVTPTSWSNSQTYVNQTFNEIVSGSTKNGVKAAQTDFYALENVPVANTDRASSILIACHLSSSNSTDTPVSLVRIPTDNSIVSEANGKGVVISLLNSSTDFGYVGTDNKFHQFDPASNLFTFKGSASYKAYEAALTLAENHNLTLAIWDKANQTYTTESGVEGKDIRDLINETLANSAYRVWYWNGGKCYYYKEIAASEIGDGEAKGTLKGLVRNHIYKLTLDGIAGFGVPVADPESRDIIPEDPTPGTGQEWQLAAKVNVLQWALMSQGVSFSNGIN